MAFAPLKKGSLYYEIRGKGAPVVLVRGLGRWSEHWCGFEDLLAALDFRVITFDGRGLGRSSLPIRMWNTMKDLAGDIAAILDHEKIEKAHIVGVSLGGMIALQFGLDYPQRTHSITAINASVGRSGHLRITPKALKVVLSASSKKPDFYPQLAQVLLSPGADSQAVTRLAESWQRIDAQYAVPIAAVSAQSAVALRWRRWEDLSKLTCPVHIVMSEGDSFVPGGNSIFIHNKIPYSILTRIPDAGHEAHMEKSDVLLNVVTGFLKKN